jgi:hypothetical protein
MTIATWMMAGGLFVLSIVSGMLGLGVAFAAVPFLGLFMTDLVHEIQPLSLFLNGVTAFFSALGFARDRLVAWREALLLCVVTTVVAPVGAWLAQFTAQRWLWGIYLVAVAFLAWRMFLPDKSAQVETPPVAGTPLAGTVGNPHAAPRLKLALALAVPISVLAGLLGVGPGFLLLPTLILVGFEPKRAAAINAVAVTPPSFSALIPHLSTAVVDLRLGATLVVVGAIGSFVGARLTSLFVPSARLKQIFGVLIVATTAYKLYQLLSR